MHSAPLRASPIASVLTLLQAYWQFHDL